MTQDDFVTARKADWAELDAMLLRGKGLHRLPPVDITRGAALYRSVCSDLMRARATGYSSDVIGLLDALAARGHNALYSAPPYRWRAAWDLLAADFPRALRRHVRFFVAALILFVGPGLVGFLAAMESRTLALKIIPEQMAEQMEEAYSEGFPTGRGEGTDSAMAGFYIYNNVGIAFRCFATGVLFGLGTVFFLVANGLILGAVTGLVTSAGHGGNLLEFTSTHGAFELTAIVIAGTAGLVMGYALVNTEGRTRFGSLRAKSKDIAHLVLGAAIMLIIAAFIEGFWSPSSLPRVVKLSAAGAAYFLVIMYLVFAGRVRSLPRRAA